MLDVAGAAAAFGREHSLGAMVVALGLSGFGETQVDELLDSDSDAVDESMLSFQLILGFDCLVLEVLSDGELPEVDFGMSTVFVVGD